MYFDDLPDLDNIIDKIKPANENKNVEIKQEDQAELIETILHVMEDYINDNPAALIEENFHETFVEEIVELMNIQFNIAYNSECDCAGDCESDCINYCDIDSDEENEKENTEKILLDTIEEAIEHFYENFMPERSFDDTFVIKQANKDIISKKLHYLKEKPQPDQRTDEWYKFRHNLITASNAYKAFEGESTRNQLIYEKCLPLNIRDKSNFVNINTPFHWGQKYEPLSVMVYEDKYNVKVGDFGCIQHDVYSFLGASPDGINIDESSPTYGRMLEIKNIVNRVIDGIPKKEYWVQMQMQMETCDLDECDFLETKFIEYEDTEDSNAFDKFNNDGSFNTSERSQLKGIIVYFAKEDGNPSYVYCPLNIVDWESFNKWEENMIQLYQSPEYKMTWIKNIYWKLEKFSCVLVLRNKTWFENSIEKLKAVWSIIEKERVSGYAHRAPNKRVKKETTTDLTKTSGCLLNFDKSEGKFVVTNHQPHAKIDNIIKIRTESFDDTKIDVHF
jgi:putative phage-type endonuclease